ncbi:MAG: DegT/DnrJ/EryC1/StrS family aminotransferase, partial [Firmicutes bacterium]|nr:DegT/DnrJ/EryC1/StrS family aminotransferase [Bacillota bacterium]
MQAREILDRLRQMEIWPILARAAANPDGIELLTGVSGSQKTLIIAALFQELASPMLVITHGSHQAQVIAADLATFLGPEKVAVFPEKELLPHEEAIDAEVIGGRVRALGCLARGERLAVVASWPALRRRVPPPAALLANTLDLEVGGRHELGPLVHALAEMGYERVEMVEGQGQFSVRGGILDVFPYHEEAPLRCEFFDEEIESIRRFSPASQRSLAQLERIDELVEYKRKIFSWYEEGLRGLKGITLNSEPEGVRSNYWMVALVWDSSCNIKKETVISLLKQKNIDSRPFFYPLSMQPAYYELVKGMDYASVNPAAYNISPYGVNLPSGMNMTEDLV